MKYFSTQFIHELMNQLGFVLKIALGDWVAFAHVPMKQERIRGAVLAAHIAVHFLVSKGAALN